MDTRHISKNTQKNKAHSNKPKSSGKVENKRQTTTASVELNREDRQNRMV